MRSGTCTVFALMTVLASTATAHAAEARDESLMPSFQPHDATSTESRYRLPEFDRSSHDIRENGTDWGTGGLSLRGERKREGNKRETSLATSHAWQRTLAADFNAWQALSQDVAIEAGARISRSKSGFAGGPLLSRQSTAISQEAYLGLRGPGQAGIKFSLFDQGGWSLGDPGDTANRMVNGEDQARKGAALEFGHFEGARYSDRPRVSLILERAQAASQPTTSSARLAFKVRF